MATTIETHRYKNKNGLKMDIKCKNTVECKWLRTEDETSLIVNTESQQG